MPEFIVNHALSSVWCTPEQDIQSILKPRRLTKPEGVWKNVDVMWRTYPLPDQTRMYHVFAIGALFPDAVGVLTYSNSWRLISEACNENNALIALYNADGVRFPASLAYYRFTEDQMLVIAVPVVSRVPVKFGTEDLYLRFYTNAFFDSVRANQTTQYLRVRGLIPSTTAQISTLGNEINALATLPGKVFCFINGLLVSRINIATAVVGDALEYIYDGSVRDIVDFPISGLQSYLSTMDALHKYFIHPPKALDTVKTIQYLDDIELFVIKPGDGTAFSGVYYHFNNADSVRMLTHRDYGLPYNYVDALARARGWTDLSGLTIRLVRKHSGYQRTLIDDAHRIAELYKLTDQQIVDVMVNNPEVATWHPTAMETSKYLEIMRSKSVDVTTAMVTEGYGYNSLTEILAPTPNALVQSGSVYKTTLPEAYQSGATALEYGADRLLLGAYDVPQSPEYAAHSTSARYVEFIKGAMKTVLDDPEDALITKDSAYTYRFYKRTEADGWVKATAGSDYIVSGNQVTWALSTADYDYFTRTDRYCCVREYTLRPNDQVFSFVLSTLDNEVATTMTYPTGKMRVYLNKHRLIEGTDYFMKFPRVVICNKEYLVSAGTADQQVTVVLYAQTEPTHEVPYGFDDAGFVKNGRLSDNALYDIRDDRVISTFIDGGIYLKSEVSWKEEGLFVTGAHLNGRPYLVEEAIVPMNPLIDPLKDTYEIIGVAHETNRLVSNYLREHLPTQATPIYSVPQRYVLYSPFFTKLIFDFINEAIVDERIKDAYSDDLVREICAPYLATLLLDPCSDDNVQDENFVYVQPHSLPYVIEVNAYVYKFMTNVVRLYLKNRVSMSGFIRIVV